MSTLRDYNIGKYVLEINYLKTSSVRSVYVDFFSHSILNTSAFSEHFLYS